MERLGVEVVVIGAGQAGLAMSYRLKAAGVLHVVLERQPAAGSRQQGAAGRRTTTA
ncbi:FAD-dependent monooxygenase [Stenotrophomonas sp. NPDC078853]|uniref:FAD-dependent monooxygenase n=1 Tax=Stenotrophomonas sp. NPDC078853 TaxID=3364534 RepID=UPI00384EC24A